MFRNSVVLLSVYSAQVTLCVHACNVYTHFLDFFLCCQLLCLLVLHCSSKGIGVSIELWFSKNLIATWTKRHKKNSATFTTALCQDLDRLFFCLSGGRVIYNAGNTAGLF